MFLLILKYAVTRSRPNQGESLTHLAHPAAMNGCSPGPSSGGVGASPPKKGEHAPSNCQTRAVICSQRVVWICELFELDLLYSTLVDKKASSRRANHVQIIK